MNQLSLPAGERPGVKRTASATSGSRAFSLTELVVVIAVLGILAAIAVPVISGLIPTQKAEVAQRNLNVLNGAVNLHAQSIAIITNTDASQVMARLQTRNPMVPGTPFFSPTARVVITSDTASYRAVWDSSTRLFRFAAPGQSGSGIDLMLLSGQTNK